MSRWKKTKASDLVERWKGAGEPSLPREKARSPDHKSEGSGGGISEPQPAAGHQGARAAKKARTAKRMQLGEVGAEGGWDALQGIPEESTAISEAKPKRRSAKPKSRARMSLIMDDAGLRAMAEKALEKPTGRVACCRFGRFPEGFLPLQPQGWDPDEILDGEIVREWDCSMSEAQRRSALQRHQTAERERLRLNSRLREMTRDEREAERRRLSRSIPAHEPWLHDPVQVSEIVDWASQPQRLALLRYPGDIPTGGVPEDARAIDTLIVVLRQLRARKDPTSATSAEAPAEGASRRSKANDA